MADAGWLRFFGANRARQHGLRYRASEAALHDILKDAPGNQETQIQHKRETMPRLPSWQGVSWADRGAAPLTGADAALDQADKLFINASQKVWHSPSVDQLAESLRAALMTTEGNQPLSAEYRPHVLLLCEFYGTRHHKIAKLESQLAEAKDQLEKERERYRSIEEHWMVQDARYKAEVKRLEMFIHETSDKGMEAVILARAGSLIRNRPGDTTNGRTSTEASPNNASMASGATPQKVNTEAAPNSALPTRQNTVLSRTRTFDTSNEVRLSNAFRKMEKTKNANSGGGRRTEAQHIGHGKAHPEHHRESQRSQSDSVPQIGQTPRDAVDEPPHEGSPERKRNSTEKAAVLQEAGVVGQLCTATESAHGHEKVKQDRVSESKPSQSTPHRRQFSFVPGDDTTGHAKAPGNQPVAQNENSQEQSTGRQTVRLRQEARRSRSSEWI
ncbi:hypothetical protein NXS19_002379 [Fusarium pseudograminearum]|uniref:Uncharacterized protein n=1 Tax=Fusarium pseudograminearum (strain CS3096) TaxID=1028729 RepID=K3UFT8_FUSPC|nr:hypothetical protein FPSE_09131 [Fusarium pseudograminearum CS3096]EKJ70621.1 hypothetical protein FPSE_09131 [Fusarium pseudograminearum CS3096]KAF0643446.1 hypothetical protein FPSE5266_09131 [Fusarium pseudograminearum]UZP34563.1 hypothetical protein NXS19_002379 [Fusarium pseudograminearum]